MGARQSLARLEKLELRLSQVTGESYSSVFGIVAASGELLRCVKRVGGSWEEVDEKPEIYLAEKLERVLYSNRRFVVVIGGRGSAKSVGVHDIVLSRVRDSGAKVMCMREFQESIAESVHSLLEEEIGRLSMQGFEVQEKAIYSSTGGEIKYRGLSRNPSSVKSAHGFDIFCCEESDNLSDRSIKTLTPTARNKAKFGTPAEILAAMNDTEEDDLAGVQMFFIANPKSANDPFSKRFINPYLDDLRRDGFYEDELHLIVMMNYDDNPWYGLSGLEGERQHDLANLSPAMYEHIWEGGYMDEVENSIISQEWFNACIDADIKKGFEPKGSIIVSLDPSDDGKDAKGLTIRQGSVILECLENHEGDAFTCIKWAADICREWKADHFIWDADGFGWTLRNEVAQQLAGLKIQIHPYRGSNAVDKPEGIYSFENNGMPIRNPVKNKDLFPNRRSQRIWGVRDRIYYTWRAVTFNEYIDPAKLISFRSTIKDIGVLRSEACKIPQKANGNPGEIQIMPKAEMKAKYKIKSPNMFDSLVGAFDVPEVPTVKSVVMPKPIQRLRM